MQNEKYTDLDLELRSMLQDAEEEVPSRVWSALNEELDRRDHRKVVALRWRRAGAAVAAAAPCAELYSSDSRDSTERTPLQPEL